MSIVPGVENEKTASETIQKLKPLLMDSVVSILAGKHVANSDGKMKLESFRGEIRVALNEQLAAKDVPSLLMAFC